jgi:hexosaminidase
MVSYAEERYVTIVPEIEMPGHSQAALAAYPEISCTGGPFKVSTIWGIRNEVYCAGNEKTFEFMENVLGEVLDLFPGEYIHVGGDECPKDRWEECPKCQDRIRAEGLHDEHELQSYFIKRMEKFLADKGRRLIGWDEILEGGLAPNATVMSWRGEVGGIAAAREGHDVVMTPYGYTYFDYYQADPENEPLAIGGFLPIDTVYSYDPVPAELDEQQRQHILGVQGQVWTEYIPTPEKAEYMAFPRACAMAEIGWTPLDRKDFNEFVRTLDHHLKRLDFLNVNYRK